MQAKQLASSAESLFLLQEVNVNFSHPKVIEVQKVKVELYTKMEEFLADKKALDSYRSIKAKNQKALEIIVDGHSYVNLSSNDYLGLAQDMSIVHEFYESTDFKNIRLSSSGSPLLTGAHDSYEKANSAIQNLFGRSALFFNSGFAANSGVISALSDADTLIIADKLAHASMIDGLTGAKGKYLRFAHNDYDHLERLIKSNLDKYDNILVVTEAVFSMDGDRADIKKLCELKKQYSNVYLYVDEAHSFCVFADNGAGLCASLGVVNEIDFILTTFGKGLGSQGACLIANQTAVNYLINTTRSLIFSTALSPLSFEHNAFMIEYMQKRNDLRERLYKISEYIHQTIKDCSLENLSQSQIIPVLTYSNENALKACSLFREKGFYAMPIRHPTVPQNKARLRLSLSAALSDDEVCALADAIKDCKEKCR